MDSQECVLSTAEKRGRLPATNETSRYTRPGGRCDTRSSRVGLITDYWDWDNNFRWWNVFWRYV